LQFLDVVREIVQDRLPPAALLFDGMGCLRIECHAHGDAVRRSTE